MYCTNKAGKVEKSYPKNNNPDPGPESDVIINRDSAVLALNYSGPDKSPPMGADGTGTEIDVNRFCVLQISHLQYRVNSHQYYMSNLL
jgi:hypothetical protein